MPDNISGMFETFLTFIADRDSDLFKHAISTADTSKTKGAGFKECHIDKTYIHTWLAWQNPPGLQLHQAINSSILDCNSPHAKIFVDWFKNLFEF